MRRIWMALATLGLASAAATAQAQLSDEFNEAATLGNWQRLYLTEQWPANQLETWDIGVTQAGHMTLVPHPSTWFNDYKAALAYKAVSGDFVVTVRVGIADRSADADEIPGGSFDMAGLMARAPRGITPETWTAGGENHVLAALGNGSSPNASFQVGRMSTISSTSSVQFSNVAGNDAMLQIARIGGAFILLDAIQGGAWTVRERYRRDDLPATLQVGLAAVTDFGSASALAPLQHNSTVIAGTPDLHAAFDWIRFAEPAVPPELTGLDLVNPLEVSDAQLLSFLGANAVPAGTAAPQTRSDFDGDGRADIFWRNSASGENYVYPMNGTTIEPTEGYVRTVADQNWQVAGIGDFDGDGKADIVWRNGWTGENYVYFMNGTAIAGEGYLRTVADQNWQVARIGDLDGDGKDDIVWRNASTGENYLYPMDGLSIKGTEGHLRTVADASWQIAGVADFDGDGKADIVWRNSASGENYLYPMDGTTILGTEGYLRTVADLDWRIVGVGDLDADGRGDIVWRNRLTGENYLYPMDGTTILGTEGYLRAVPDTDWKVKALGDYDGDGKADILWRNAMTGENYLYLMDGTSIAGEGYLRTVADLAWRPAGGPARADKADIVFAFDTTGSLDGEITNLKMALSVSIIPSIRATLPDAAFGLVDFRDFGEPGGEWVVKYRHRVQTAFTAAGLNALQVAVNQLAGGGGGDVPEAGWEAMYSIAGGPPITVAEYTSTFNLAITPPLTPTAGETQGSVAGAHLRPGAVPIVIAITDADWHDAPGSGGLHPYGAELSGVPSRAQAIARLKAIDARVISVVALDGVSDARTQGRLLAEETGATVLPAAWGAARPVACGPAQCCTGVNSVGEAPSSPGGACPLVYSISSNGTGLGATVVDGVRMMMRAEQ
jgi:hypothetical protein